MEKSLNHSQGPAQFLVFSTLTSALFEKLNKYGCPEIFLNLAPRVSNSATGFWSSWNPKIIPFVSFILRLHHILIWETGDLGQVSNTAFLSSFIFLIRKLKHRFNAVLDQCFSQILYSKWPVFLNSNPFWNSFFYKTIQNKSLHL